MMQIVAQIYLDKRKLCTPASVTLPLPPSIEQPAALHFRSSAQAIEAIPSRSPLAARVGVAWPCRPAGRLRLAAAALQTLCRGRGCVPLCVSVSSVGVWIWTWIEKPRRQAARRPAVGLKL